MDFISLSPTKSVNIDFFNIIYTIQESKNKSKTILNNISGRFKSGQLSAILGPSGAGKTTLLNILAGYRLEETDGTILINGKIKDKKKFSKISRYIMEESAIQKRITIKEIMMIAAHLKLGNNVSDAEKAKITKDILKSLRLFEVQNTQSHKLSGGEVKRLIIALELINNPAVLFLDEPTTGLDEVSALSCIQLLEKLAKNGKTVVCTIHAPSAKLFSSFDYSYFMSSNGQCVYQGSGSYLVPYLSGMGIECPINYNPADFVIELCSGDILTHQEQMMNAIQNGEKFYENGHFYTLGREEIENKTIKTKDKKLNQTNNWLQFKILLFRMWLFYFRNKKNILVKISLSFALGLLTGMTYLNIATDSLRIRYSYGLFIYCIVFYLFTPMMPLLQQIPLDMIYLKREYFNGWYSLRSYFFALTFSTLPDQVILAVFFSTPILILSGQPLELTRYFGFYSICFLTSLIVEGYAVIVGSLMNIVNASFIGSISTGPYVMLAVIGFGMEYSTISLIDKIFMYSSYLRYSFEIMFVTMLQGRKLECPDDTDICLFKSIDYYFKMMSMDQANLWLNYTVLFIFLIALKFLGYFCFKQRLTSGYLYKRIKKIKRLYT